MLRQTIFGIGFMLCGAAPALAEMHVPITFLQQIPPRPPVLSNLDPVPDDLGSAGESGSEDNDYVGMLCLELQ